jgi:hypothetical protein
MAIFGGIGKRLNLGSAEQIVTRVTGSPLAGAIAGEVSEGISGLGRSVTSNVGQGVAVSQANTPPAETAMSGERGPTTSPTNIYAPTVQPAVFRTVPGAPAQGQGMRQQTGLPAIIQGGRAVTGGIGGMLGIAGGAIAVAPVIIDQFGNEKKLRVTRRLRSQVKRAVEMFGVEAVADQMGTDVEVIFYILTKKMRNDGPYVTKAAVRKTRQTVRKMKHLCDMYDDLRPAAKRRAPARTTSRVTQIKN